MSCLKLYSGQDYACDAIFKKYYQQIVLVNKADVLNYVINGPSLTQYDSGIELKNRIRFNLKPGKKGFLFRGPENGSGYFAMFSKEIDDNIPQYIHQLQLPIFGASEKTKGILKTLDVANYFAAIQYMDGTVEIYGFENGLTTDDYDFDLQNNGGGSFINLVSPESGMEDNPPYVYVPVVGTANKDFNKLFEDIPDGYLGDFNDDFNDDFDIT